jgi:hypothetical protein
MGYLYFWLAFALYEKALTIAGIVVYMDLDQNLKKSGYIVR